MAEDLDFDCRSEAWTAIHTAHDAEGLQLALRELFEEAFLRDALEEILDKVDNEGRERIEQDTPARTLSPGYFQRAVYLLDLASAIERGVHYTAATLTRDDVRGLEAVKRARAWFETEHPACPACGTRQQNKFMTQCGACRHKLRSE